MPPELHTFKGYLTERRNLLRDLARLHFDVAGFPLPRQLDALLALTTLEHLHYGSDYPFTPAPACDALLRQLEATELLDDAMRRAIFTTNAEALFTHPPL